MNRFRFNPFIKWSSKKSLTALPLTLTRKRIYILPNRYGWLFIIVLLALLMGSVNYKNNLGFLLTFLLGSMAFISIFHTYRNLYGIQIFAVTAKAVFAGEQAVFKLHIRPTNAPRTAVAFSFSKEEATLTDLTADADNWIHIPLTVLKRGIFRPKTLQIFTHYPFGLFHAWSSLSPDVQCLVYPKPLSGPLDTAPGGNSTDGQPDKNRPGAEDFQGLKSYQPGDPLQHIAWKAFSRGQGLFTKLFVEQAGASAMLDWSALKEPDTERKLSRLCGMVLKAHDLNLSYGLKLPGKTIEPDCGDAHRRNCLKALALYGLH